MLGVLPVKITTNRVFQTLQKIVQFALVIQSVFFY